MTRSVIKDIPWKRIRVKLKDITDNPYRDLKRHPRKEDKIDSLITSMKKTGNWGGIKGRPDGRGKVQQAFGHHRKWALIDLVGSDYEVEVEVADLSEEQMIQLMAHENSTEWGATSESAQEAIKAVVSAYAKGTISLPCIVKDTPKSSIRHAPSFTVGEPSDNVSERPYTMWTAANFLGWSYDHGDIHNKVKEAFAVLEAEELEVMSEEATKEMTSSHANKTGNVKRRDFTTVARAGKKTYQAKVKEAEKAEPDMSEERRKEVEQEAKKTARKVTETLAKKAVEDGLSTNEANKEVDKATTNGKVHKKKECPIPMIDEVAVKAQGKFNKFLSEADSDWEWVEQLFQHSASISKENRRFLSKCINRLKNVLGKLEEALEEAKETDDEVIVLKAKERKMLQEVIQ